jgi:hypothetical protein
MTLIEKRNCLLTQLNFEFSIKMYYAQMRTKNIINRKLTILQALDT